MPQKQVKEIKKLIFFLSLGFLLISPSFAFSTVINEKTAKMLKESASSSSSIEVRERGNLNWGISYELDTNQLPQVTAWLEELKIEDAYKWLTFLLTKGKENVPVSLELTPRFQLRIARLVLRLHGALLAVKNGYWVAADNELPKILVEMNAILSHLSSQKVSQEVQIQLFSYGLEYLIHNFFDVTELSLESQRSRTFQFLGILFQAMADKEAFERSVEPARWVHWKNQAITQGTAALGAIAGGYIVLAMGNGALWSKEMAAGIFRVLITFSLVSVPFLGYLNPIIEPFVWSRIPLAESQKPCVRALVKRFDIDPKEIGLE